MTCFRLFYFHYVLDEHNRTNCFSVIVVSSGIVQSNVGFSVPSSILSLASEGIPLLEAVSIITRSMHNCKLFGYYGGVQKLTALMKGKVIATKSIEGYKLNYFKNL